MAKFIIGVAVGIFIGASVSAYEAVAAGPGKLSGWTGTNNGGFFPLPVSLDSRPASCSRVRAVVLVAAMIDTAMPAK